MSAARKIAWVTCYAVAMGLVEAAVVVYLRALHPGDVSLSQVLGVLPVHIVTIEVAREAATLLMLAAVAALTGSGRAERFWYFAFAFAVWDLMYYAWLWVMIGWPPSLFTWDVLFLIPVPWTAPVLAPGIVSLLLAGGAAWLLLGREGTRALKRPRYLWAGAVLGSSLILYSFVRDYRAVVGGTFPASYGWGWFVGGVVIGLGGFGLAVGPRRSASGRRPQPERPVEPPHQR